MKQLLIICIIISSNLLSIGQVDSTKIFENSKGKWPLPLPKYLKIYDNENLKHFTVNMFDSTLRIITDSSYQVNAIHAGIVVSVFESEGEYSVLTKFGEYFIAYNRLSDLGLKEGEFIEVGEPLGQIVKNWTEENYTLEIMLSKGTKELSAGKWIAW